MKSVFLYFWRLEIPLKFLFVDLVLTMFTFFADRRGDNGGALDSRPPGVRGNTGKGVFIVVATYVKCLDIYTHFYIVFHRLLSKSGVDH